MGHRITSEAVFAVTALVAALLLIGWFVYFS